MRSKAEIVADALPPGTDDGYYDMPGVKAAILHALEIRDAESHAMFAALERDYAARDETFRSRIEALTDEVRQTREELEKERANAALLEERLATVSTEYDGLREALAKADERAERWRRMAEETQALVIDCARALAKVILEGRQS